jgi:hypothetical protein
MQMDVVRAGTQAFVLRLAPGKCLRCDCRVLKCSFPIVQADLDATLAAAQAALVADAVNAGQAAGRSLSPQAAVTWGLHAIHVTEQPMVA